MYASDRMAAHAAQGTTDGCKPSTHTPCTVQEWNYTNTRKATFGFLTATKLQVPVPGEFFLLDKAEIGIRFRNVKKAQLLSGERLVNTLSSLPNFSTQFILIDRVLADSLPLGLRYLNLRTKVLLTSYTDVIKPLQPTPPSTPKLPLRLGVHHSRSKAQRSLACECTGSR